MFPLQVFVPLDFSSTKVKRPVSFFLYTGMKPQMKFWEVYCTDRQRKNTDISGGWYSACVRVVFIVPDPGCGKIQKHREVLGDLVWEDQSS